MATEVRTGARHWQLEIRRDDGPQNPVDDWSWATFAGWHKRYRVGNEQPTCEPREYCAELDAEHGADLIILPVYVHDHGGCTYSCSDPRDPWDSGQVGWIWTTRARMLADGFSEQDITEAETMLREMIDTYSAWASGDVWGYVATEYERCPHCNESREVGDGDACWGFIGSDKDAQDNLRAEVPEQVKHLFDKAWSDRE